MQTVILLLTAFGAGGLITAWAQSLLDSRKRIGEKEHDFKLLRYKCITLLMQARINWEGAREANRINRPDIKNLQDLNNELKAELSNALLFSEEGVIVSLGDFIKSPNGETFAKAVISMRKDLWGKSSKIGEEVLRTQFVPLIGKQQELKESLKA
ncbi:MAG: hypothetical protein Q8R91_10260 [Candidatus Omnitrophota bacterium]|nr:hypothetical protein [Candidatus Omnitrophota bacterium]